MTIATYSDLKTAIQNHYARSDSTFTNRLDDFIDLAEDRIHYGDLGRYPSEPLRVLGIETTGDLTINAQSVAQPTGFLSARRLYLNTDPKADLEFLPPDRFWATDVAADSGSGKPICFTIEGSNFVFGPTPDATYTGKLLYHKKLDALSDSSTTNWLLTNSPGTYLYACLLEAALWDMDYERAEAFAVAFSGRMNALMRQDRRQRIPRVPLSMRADVVR